MTLYAVSSAATDGVIYLAALLSAVFGILGLSVKVWQAVKRAAIKAHEAADLAAEQTALLERITRELFENGGSSLRDAVDRVEAGLADHLEFSEREIGHIDHRFEQTNARIDAVLMRSSGYAGPMRRATDRIDPTTTEEGELG